MPRKLLQGLLARFCIGRPKVADDNEEEDIVGRIAGRLTRASCTEERRVADAGSATETAVTAADGAASADGPLPAELETDLATLPVAEPEPLQSQLQGPAAKQHLIETCQAQRWKAIHLSNWEAELEVREAALQRHETELQRYAEIDLSNREAELEEREAALQRHETELQRYAEIDLSNREAELEEREAALQRHETELQRYAEIDLSNREAELEEREAALQRHETELQRYAEIDLSNREAELEEREAALQRHETELQRYGTALQQWAEEAEEDLRQRGQELCQRGKAVKQVDAVTMLRHGTADEELDIQHKNAHHAVIGIHANATAAAQAYHPLSAAQQGKQAEPAKAPTPQRLHLSKRTEAPAMDLLAAAGSAPAPPDLPEGLGWTQCPHGYFEPVTGAEPPHSAPESLERRQSNTQLNILMLELGDPYAHSRCGAVQAGGAHQGPMEQLKGQDTQLWRQAPPTQEGGLDLPAEQAGGAHQVDAVAALQHSPADEEGNLQGQKGHPAVFAIHADVTAAAQAHPTLNAAQQSKQAEPAQAPTPQRLQAAECNPSPGSQPLQPSAWQVHQVTQAGHADAAAWRTGDAGQTCWGEGTEINLQQRLVETAIARALHAERQQAEQQRQLVQYHDAAKREVSGVRRRCAEEVARALQRAAEKQGFFHTAPHQICQDTLALDRVLGQGAFGVAQQVYSPAFGWMVAKLIQSDAEPYVPGMYRQEAEMLCGLAHPNIVRGYGLITDAADPTQIRGLLMEELDGDLSSLLAPNNRHVLTHGRLMGYAWQAAQALAYCHAQGTAHLDIKPENFLLCGTEDLKLADFGLALRAGPKFAKQALGRGTQGYMAPELTTGLHMASDKADVWSLGMTFLTMVTFHHPYEGLTSQQYDAALRRRAWPEWHQCDMPAQWSVLLQLCLQWDPAERASMQQLADFLEQCQD